MFELTPRHISVKLLLTIIFGTITVVIATCPCQRVGNCHFSRLIALILGGLTVLTIENSIPK